MILRPRWYGDKYPEKGHYLASDRPRYAYLILTVEVTRKFTSAEDPARLHLEVIRVAAKHVPDGATIWPFKWDSRGPKKDRHTPAI